MLVESSAPARAAHLAPPTVDAWNEYVQSACMRMAQRLEPDASFLLIDEKPEWAARVRAGEIVIFPAGSHIPKKVPNGLIHDWIGAVFIPKASLSDVMYVVRDYPEYKNLYKPSVVESITIATGDDEDRFSMTLINRSLLLKTAFYADYETRYVKVDSHREYSISETTRVQQIEEYGAPEQHMLLEGEGKGIIWKAMGIARYLERDEGVYLEFEAIALSRDIPASVRLFVDPVVRRVSRNSLLTSLEETEKAVLQRAETAGHDPAVPQRVGLSHAESNQASH